MQAFGKVMEFSRDVAREAKKITWPTRQEVGMSTLMIVVMIALVSVFLLIADLLLSGAVKALLNLA